MITNWNGQPALISGRVYASNFDTATEAYSRWYSALVRWIRSHFVKNPDQRLGGFVGKTAFELFRQGGVLLPAFLPPMDPQWLSFFEDQARLRPTLTPSDTARVTKRRRDQS